MIEQNLVSFYDLVLDNSNPIQAFSQKAGFPNTAYICLAKIQMLGKWNFATFSIVQSERFLSTTFKVDVVEQTVIRALIGPIPPELSSNRLKFSSTNSITNVFTDARSILFLIVFK